MGRLLAHDFFTRLIHPFPRNNSFTTQNLKVYLLLIISDDLSWGKHMDNITKKVNQTIGFSKYNMYTTIQQYINLLCDRSWKYTSHVWPHTNDDTYTIESAQGRVAGLAVRDNRHRTSVIKPRTPIRSETHKKTVVMM